MAEKESFATTPSYDERNELQELQKQAAAKQAEVEQLEQWGKYDVTAPSEGEMTYQEYLAQRPAEGVVRNGEGGFVNTATGEAASEDEYAAQLESLANASGANESESGGVADVDYKSMSLMQLKLEAARLTQLGDRANKEDLSRAVNRYLKTDSKRDDSESNEQKTERYNKEVEQFWKDVDAIVAKNEAKQPEPDAPAETEYSAEDSDEGQQENPQDNQQEGPQEGPQEKQQENAENEQESQADRFAVGEKVELNGEAVTVKNHGILSDGRRILEVEYPDGVVMPIYEDEAQALAATSEPSKEENPSDDAENTEASQSVPNAEASAEVKDDDVPQVEGYVEQPKAEDGSDLSEPPLPPANNDDAVPMGKEVIPWTPENKEVALMPEEEKSRWERFKAAFKRERDAIRKFGGSAWFAGKWETVKHGIRERTIDHGVTDEMSDEEKEKRRKKNRVIMIAGGATIAAAGIATAIVLAKHGMDHSSAMSSLDLPQHNTGSGTSGTEQAGFGVLKPGANNTESHFSLDQLSKQMTESANSGATSGGSGGEIAPQLPLGSASSSISTESLASTYENMKEIYNNIPRNMGGELLFKNLGLDVAKWYNNQDTLLSLFPSDFYRMSDGNVGISHTGQLSTATQNFIESLR